jgi:hypothetical protein
MSHKKNKTFKIEVEVKARQRGGRRNTEMDSRPKRLRTRKSRSDRALKEWS